MFDLDKEDIKTALKIGLAGLTGGLIASFISVFIAERWEEDVRNNVCEHQRELLENMRKDGVINDSIYNQYTNTLVYRRNNKVYYKCDQKEK